MSGEAVRDLIDWLDPRPSQSILDLGCGDGAVALEITRRGARVTGADIDPAMVQAAAGRGIDARLLDGHALPFEGAFDAVFSRDALHWMGRPNAVISGAWRALKPGGRFVGEFAGFGHAAAVRVALLALARSRGIDPGVADHWFLPDEEGYARRLIAGGFTVEQIARFPDPAPLPETGIRAWLRSFAASALEQIPAGRERDSALEEMIASLRPLRSPNGRWIADFVTLRFAARRG
jgi:SAM-dependent methyltransferase